MLCVYSFFLSELTTSFLLLGIFRSVPPILVFRGPLKNPLLQRCLQPPFSPPPARVRLLLTCPFPRFGWPLFRQLHTFALGVFPSPAHETETLLCPDHYPPPLDLSLASIPTVSSWSPPLGHSFLYNEKVRLSSSLFLSPKGLPLPPSLSKDFVPPRTMRTVFFHSSLGNSPALPLQYSTYRNSLLSSTSLPIDRSQTFSHLRVPLSFHRLRCSEPTLFSHGLWRAATFIRQLQTVAYSILHFRSR